ncbi:MAG: FtsX-like permease family protein [Acidimicrobiales bacterium]
MDVLQLVVRAVVRQRWRTHLAVALLVALIIGVALMTAAGARRTSSAYGRFAGAVNVSTITVSSVGAYDSALDDAVAALPEVVRSTTTVGVEARVLVDDVPVPAQALDVSTSFDGRYVDHDRMTILEGRAADPDRPDEVVVNQRAAERLGYRVDQQLQLGLYTIALVSSPTVLEEPAPVDRRRTVTIVGVAVLPEEVLQDDFGVLPRMFVTPALADDFPDSLTYGIQGLTLRRGDADIAGLRRGLAELDLGGLPTLRRTSTDAYHAEQALQPLALALALFAAIAFLAGLVLASQAVARSVRSDAATGAVLRAIGTSRTVVVAAAAGGPVGAVTVGIVVAALLAVLASRAMPVGPMRNVEPDAGVDIDWTVLVVGGAAALLVTTLAAVWAARSSTVVPASRRLGTIEQFLETAEIRPDIAAGVREALGGSAHRSARSVLAGACVAVGAVVAAITFGSSLDNLVEEPSLYGWNADLAVLSGLGYGNFDDAGVTAALADVAAWSGGYFGSSQIDDRDVDLLAMEPGAALPPPLLNGRSIADDDEVVLGSRTADELGREVGDVVELLGADGLVELRVVGIATLPTIGRIHAAHPSLGVGAVVARSVLPGLDRDITGTPVTGVLGPNVLFVRLPPDTDPAAAAATLTEELRPFAGFAGIDTLTVQRPAEIVNAGSLGAAPLSLAVALAAGALASLGVASAASVRRRRHEFAVFKALGFTRRQLRASVAWHATVTAAVGLLLGVPVGIALGGSLWRRFAGQLDVVAEVTIPTTAIVGLASAVLLAVNIVAWGPARRASRVTAASDLRPSSISVAR